MSIELTDEQKRQLSSWADQRDAFLSEISVLRSEKEALLSDNKNLCNSNTEIENRINEGKGRIIELLEAEKASHSMTQKDVVSLREEKSSLQSEVADLKVFINALNDQSEKLQKSITISMETLKDSANAVKSLDKVVGDTTSVNKDNAVVISELVKTAKSGLETIVSRTEEIVARANDVIVELPKVFLEAKRQSLERNIIKKVKT